MNIRARSGSRLLSRNHHYGGRGGGIVGDNAWKRLRPGTNSKERERERERECSRLIGVAQPLAG
eukprot:scaffold96678_cov52-Phaeocystis_antarctica.AAC.1